MGLIIRAFTGADAAKSAATRRRQAEENPNNVRAAGELRRQLAGGAPRCLSALARHLNEAGLFTATGRLHTAQSVKLLLARHGL